MDGKKYEIDEKTAARLENDFSNHPAKGDQRQRYEAMWENTRSLARFLCENCPPSRELSLALTHLEEASMYAIAAISRNE